MSNIIGGIQQIGIGVPNNQEMFDWYMDHFGSDIKVFDDEAEAPLMTKYTGGEVQTRSAIMAVNLQGGGGFEIWKYTSRDTVKPKFQPQLGDKGIFVSRIKCKNVSELFEKFKAKGTPILGELNQAPNGEQHFFVQDPHGNIFNIVPGHHWFKDEDKLCGGVGGAMIGVSNIDDARKLYSNVMGYDRVYYDKTDVFSDLSCLPGGDKTVRRVLLGHSESRKGAFSELFGPSKIELIEQVEGKSNTIFKDRFWGDSGYIHLCLDVSDMEGIKTLCEANGFEFTVDSGSSFDMGDAAGRFAYVEDPDGTLIEFVEAHRMPIIKKWNWYWNLKKRNQQKPLPRWIINALRFSRVK